MSTLPVSPKTYFSDFAFDLKTYSVIRQNLTQSVIQGLDNEENHKPYVHFPISCDVQAGDILKCDDEQYLVTKIGFDTYQGKKALLKAFITLQEF